MSTARLAQAAAESERDRVTAQLQKSVVGTEVGRAKVLLYDELLAKAETLVSRAKGGLRWVSCFAPGGGGGPG
jgi:hypothetical protein